MKKKIKRTLLIVMTLVLVSAAAVAITWAAAADVAQKNLGEKNNVFTSGNITTELSEVRWNKKPGTNDSRSEGSNPNDTPKDGEDGETKAKNYVLGGVYEKNPKMTNTSEDNIEEWVAIKVTYAVTIDGTTYYYKRSQFETEIAKLCSDQEGNMEGYDTTKWDANDDGTMFYYKEKLAQNTSTSRLFQSVKVNNLSAADGKYSFKVYSTSEESLSDTEIGGGTSPVKTDSLPSFTITVQGYAVSADGIELDQAKTDLNKLAGITA